MDAKENLSSLKRRIFAGKEFLREEQLIVVVKNQRQAENLSDYLGKFGIVARYVHGGVESMTRETLEREFSQKVIQVLIAPGSFQEVLPPFGNISRVTLQNPSDL